MRRMRSRRSSKALATLLLAAGLGSVSAQPQDGSFGLELRKTASAQDVEMPVYPKAERQPEAGKEAGAISMGVWSPSLGFRLSAIKFTSADSAAQITTFYREALAQHGTVLECTSENSGKPDRAAAAAERETLTCDDKPKPGHIVLKVGQRKDFRAVAIRQRAGGAEFDLVRLRLRE